mgnify:CR=1 FL=1
MLEFLPSTGYFVFDYFYIKNNKLEQSPILE